MIYFNPLLDKDFLLALDKEPLKETFAEIYLLNQEEEVIESIEGSITQGSVSVDGSSSVRRTCSITIAANELNIHEYYWGLNCKFRLQIGLKNNINEKYPEIIWFPQGVFVITGFNTSQTTSNYMINIQGKDKMTRLNGEFGGTITSLTHNFGEYDYINEEGYTTTQKALIKDIITDAVHEFAKEPIQNIIINDLDDYGLELMEYRGKDPLYIIINNESDESTNVTLNGEQEYRLKDGTTIKLKDIENYNPLFYLMDSSIIPTLIYDDNGNAYTAAKIEYGMTCGYRLTDLVYAGDLILNVGETITSLLDKIVSMLGEFEYYYDIDGRFIFQRKKTYISLPFNTIRNNLDEEYVDNVAYSSSISYFFEDANLITSFSNNPDYANLKNDFSLWGTRESVTGNALPVHIRFAIDNKPEKYVNYEGTICYSVYPIDNEIENKVVDWREIIYQMALDFRRYNRRDEFYTVIRKNNMDLYPNGKTGYEHYYTDLEGFWRQLYNPDYEGSFKQVFVIRETYENGDFENYYYAKTLYTQCNSDIQYRSGVQYYTLKDNYSKGYAELVPTSVTAVNYYNNPDNYYYINDNEPYEIVNCLIEEPYRDLDGIYYDDNYNKVIKSKDEYELDKKNLYFVESTSEKPCFIKEVYQDYYEYYYINGDARIEDLTKNIYDEDPSLYYRLEKIYEQCNKDSVFDKGQIYYTKGKASTKDYDVYTKTLTNQERFDKDPERYYIYISTEKVICCQPEGYYSSFKEYKVLPREEENIDIKNNYNIYAAQARLFEIIPQYTPCVRPLPYNTDIVFYEEIKDEYNEDGWLSTIFTSPETLNFWFDFLDDGSEISKFSCRAIGNRPKAVNDNNIKSIYFRETPTVIFVNAEDWKNDVYKKLGYTYIQIDRSKESLFSISSQGKSAKDVLDEFLYKYAYCAESISMSSIPIYYLQPNTRIFVKDYNSGINGEYIMTRYSLPLGNSGQMSISATKAVDRLY